MGANIKNKEEYVYFLYSENQEKDRKAIDKTMAKVFTPGTVIVNGTRKKFTEMSKKSSNRYADCKIIAEGYKSKMVYTPVSSV